MNLTSSIAAVLALSTSQIYIGTYQCPPGTHTIDLNSLTVNKCTGAGSNPDMANTSDSNFTILGDPSGGTYIAPTTYVANGVMFHVLGGKVTAKDLRFNGVPLASGGLAWTAFKLEGDTQIATPTTREFLMEDCEFRYVTHAVQALNYENIRLRRNRFEVTPDSVNGADAQATVHLDFVNGSQNVWLRENDYMGGTGIRVDDTSNPSVPSAGWLAGNHFWMGENMLNMFTCAHLYSGQNFLIEGCRMFCDDTTTGRVGFDINPNASVPNTKTMHQLVMNANYIAGKVPNRLQIVTTQKIALTANQIIGPGGGGGAVTGLNLLNCQDISITGNLFRGNLTDIKTNSTCVGVNCTHNYISSGSSINDAGTIGRWQYNRQVAAFSGQNLVPSNTYQTTFG